MKGIILTLIIIGIITAIGFGIGWHTFDYYNPIKVCEPALCEPVITPETADTAVLEPNADNLKDIEKDGQIATYQTKIQNCWWSYNQLEVSYEKLKADKTDIGNCENKVSGLESDLIACQNYQEEINISFKKLEQNIRELQNALLICSQQK